MTLVGLLVKKVETMKKYDAFISYAFEDKDAFALPLAAKLKEIKLNIWFDDFCLKVGDSLRKKIDFGLSNSNYGIVILSRYFFEKQWPQKELNALYHLEIEGKSVILPVWKDISKKEIIEYSPLLADKYAAQAYDGVNKVASKLVEVIDPTNQYPDTLIQEELAKLEPTDYPDIDIRVSGSADQVIKGATKFYDSSKTYICISVSNWGTRDVIINKAGLHLQRAKKPFFIAVDSLYFGPRRLKDGDRADYLIEQHLVDDISLIDYVWATDQVGRYWRGEMKS
jgi:hypothetical protein